MKVGIIGLGKMGLNIALNLKNNDFDVIGYDVQESVRNEANINEIKTVNSVEELVSNLVSPKIVWVMLPAGDITKNMIKKLSETLETGDYVIDGGNSFYQDSLANYEILKEKNINFFDSGTSGGVSGALNGGNFMIGGDSDKFGYIEPIFKKLAQKDGYLYTGPAGSGHYLKMVHNGIEYGMMEAIGEGFDLLQRCPYKYDNEKVAKLWNNGSVVRSWLMELAEQAFSEDPNLDGIKGIMYASGEGQWTVEEALRRNVNMPVITLALMMRYRSLEEDTFTGKVVASLRKGFGGHKVAK
ncbi:phosphogluconate dehydrogenase (NAD(+)-dependent, decarboxylating) [Thomasclavelia spiroformis]|uniref:phosphogluconate dehydrogenase (NAD(+)-dependent, decarboxylating) n=1 Tax=Thomasclavelia spiroformis TaxID=29348 RepID=UPI0024B164B5|nr:decarboxylating 6-phosphogluconate dehydrogenase [Thomasclavelia spiroformis]